MGFYFWSVGAGTGDKRGVDEAHSRGTRCGLLCFGGADADMICFFVSDEHLSYFEETVNQ